MPFGTRAPKELLHHLPALVMRRPSVSADPPERGREMRGSRLLDRRPPHYRCPAVPRLKTSARAILMALRSSVLPSGNNHSSNGYCVLLVIRTAQRPVVAPLFGSQPRRPSCVCSGLEPHCRTSRCARPQPTPSPRLLLTDFTAGYCHCVNCVTARGGPLSLRATRSGRQSRRRPATALASKLHHRTVLRTATTGAAARQFVSAEPFFTGLREKP